MGVHDILYQICWMHGYYRIFCGSMIIGVGGEGVQIFGRQERNLRDHHYRGSRNGYDCQHFSAAKIHL